MIQRLLDEYYFEGVEDLIYKAHAKKPFALQNRAWDPHTLFQLISISADFNRYSVQVGPKVDVEEFISYVHNNLDKIGLAYMYTITGLMKNYWLSVTEDFEAEYESLKKERNVKKLYQFYEKLSTQNFSAKKIQRQELLFKEFMSETGLYWDELESYLITTDSLNLVYEEIQSPPHSSNLSWVTAILDPNKTRNEDAIVKLVRRSVSLNRVKKQLLSDALFVLNQSPFERYTRKEKENFLLKFKSKNIDEIYQFVLLLIQNKI